MTKLNKLVSVLPSLSTYMLINFGCRVNMAETNLVGEYLSQSGLKVNFTNPNLIFINTCSITQKGEYESLSKIRSIQKKFPKALIVTSGCATFKILNPKYIYLNNLEKEIWLESLNSSYQPSTSDKFTNSHRFLLKVQSGCRHNCSYCIVPARRSYSRFLPLPQAVGTTQKAIKAGYQEIIITGVNLGEYLPGLSNLVKALLTQTKISRISFGSIPLFCLDNKLLELYKLFPTRLSHFLHVPIQSGSDRVLKLMNRHYSRSTIVKTLQKFKSTIKHITFGTDIIVGFPSETEKDFQETYALCKSFEFKKIHTFRYSPRPGTVALELWKKSPVKQSEINYRSRLIRSLISQTKLPSHQTPGS